MKTKTMTHNMLGTKMASGTSMFAAVVAWLPQLEAGLRVGASVIAIVAGVYAILNYRADLRAKREDSIKRSKSKTK